MGEKNKILITDEQYVFAMKYIVTPEWRDKLIYPCTNCDRYNSCDAVNCVKYMKYRQEVNEVVNEKGDGVYELIKYLRTYADLCRVKLDIEKKIEECAKNIDEKFDIK